VRFIQDPNVGPAAGCVTGLAGPKFVTGAYLDAGVYRVARWLRISLRAPERTAVTGL
jgi:hypothetical protein